MRSAGPDSVRRKIGPQIGQPAFAGLLRASGIEAFCKSSLDKPCEAA